MNLLPSIKLFAECARSLNTFYNLTVTRYLKDTAAKRKYEISDIFTNIATKLNP